MEPSQADSKKPRIQEDDPGLDMEAIRAATGSAAWFPKMSKEAKRNWDAIGGDVPMPEQAATASDVVRAKRWAWAIVASYAIIPALFFGMIIFLRPYKADEALTVIGYVYVANFWLLGVALLAYRQIIKAPQSLMVRVRIAGALVILGLVNLLYLLSIAGYFLYPNSDGQVGAFIGLVLLVFSPVFAAIGWGVGDFIGGFICWVIDGLNADRTRQQPKQ